MKKGSRSGWILAICLVAVLGGAAAYILSSQRAMRSLAHVSHAAARPAALQRNTRVLYLAAPRQLTIKGNWAFPSLLAREVVRQSILLAAREELGLSTRDGVLGESPAKANSAASYVRLDAEYLKPASFAYTVYDAENSPDPVASDELPITGPAPEAPDYFALVKDAETRSRKQYVNDLMRLGFSKVARVTASTRPAIGDDVESKLAELTEISQFAAIRQAHAAVAAAGDSPEWLGVLVRGYANLGQLTYFHWNAAHDVFVARSLLYAQRMVAADPESANARWHRAYALALAGLHKHALEDLAAARAMGKVAAPPAWVELLEPLCRYQTEKLLDLAAADKARAPLAMYLCYLTVEHCGSTSATIEMAKAALEVNPLCMRLIDGMCRHAGVGYLHALTQMGPALFRSSLSRSLSRLDNLPPNVRRSLDAGGRNWQDPQALADLCQSLVDAPDSQELSWTALGRLLQEINFVHVEMQVEFLAIYLGVDPAPAVRALVPLVKDHPFKPYIDALACYSSGNPDLERIREIMGSFNFPDVRRTMLPAIQLTRWINTPGLIQGDAAWSVLQGSIDNTAWDQEERCSMDGVQQWKQQPKAFPQIAARLADLSPYAPNAIAVQIIFDWNNAQQHLAQWQREYPGHPAVNAALAWQYTSLKQYDKAEPFFRAYLKKAPDAWAYRMLANNYRLQGDRKKWLETIDESLKQEDYGLDHAATQTQVANELMDEGDFKAAEPYADAAAESYMGIGLLAAARCHEGLREWEASEKWIKAYAGRYERPMDYFFWCVRTGHGDRTAAAKAASDWIESLGYRSEQPLMAYRLSFYLLDNQPANAADAAKRLMAATGEPWAGVHLALLDLRDGNAAGASAALADVERRGPAYRVPYTNRPRPEMVKVAGLFRQTLAAGKSAALDLSAVEDAMADTNAEEQANICYFIARFLELRGNPEAAVKYMRRATHGAPGDANVLLAIQAIRLHSPTTAPLAVP